LTLGGGAPRLAPSSFLISLFSIPFAVPGHGHRAVAGRFSLPDDHPSGRQLFCRLRDRFRRPGEVHCRAETGLGELAKVIGEPPQEIGVSPQAIGVLP